MSNKCSKWRDADVWFCTDQSDGWVAGTVVEAHENKGVWKFSIRPCLADAGVVTLWPQCCPNSRLQTYSYNTSHVEFITLKRRNLQDARLCGDLTKVRGISEPEVERILAERFMQHQFYTEVGPVLMYLNYWGDLDDSPTSLVPPTMQEVWEAGERRLLHQIAPHPYKLADRVYRSMNLDARDAIRHENQTILLTGESGSGKTRNLHYILEYLTYCSSKVAQQAGVLFAYDSEVEDLIHAANVITTAFGCAPTHAGNPSSSRYGKYIELYYSDLGFLEGSSLRTFLLESGRVTGGAGGDHQSNFNVFSEIAAGLNGYEKADFGFHVSPEFRYLASEYTSVDGLTREHERHHRHYGQLRQAMTNVGMSPLRQIEAIKVLVGILHLGNITFESLGCGSDGGTNSEEDVGMEGTAETNSASNEGVMFTESCRGHVDFACKILGFSMTDLCGALTTKTVKVSGKTVVTQNDEAASLQVRDTLAKTLYHSLFKWICVEINCSLSENLNRCRDDDEEGNGDHGESCLPSSAAHIGILDIFGLDSSRVNHFDQMCQNYANEILQCHFFSVILDGQTKNFSEDTGQWIVNSETAANVDSSKHIDIFESAFCGIFPILNSVMHSENPSEEQFMTILRKSNAGNPLLIFDRDGYNNKQFTIRHYAYDVTYSVDNVIDMNQGLREINFATLSTSKSRFSTDTGGGSRRTSSGSSVVSPSRGQSRRTSRNDPLLIKGGGGSTSFTGSVNSKTPPPSDKSKYKKVKTSMHKKQPIAQTFMTEINELVSQMRGTQSHFLQCIKCSYEDTPDVYESSLVAQQLRYCSCMKSIEALQQDKSLCMPYKSFVTEYSCLLYMVGKCAMTRDAFAALQVLQTKPKNKNSQKQAVLCMVEIIPTIGAIVGEIESNPSFVQQVADQHCYDGFIFSDTSLRFSAEYLELLESLRRSTINVIATRVQRVWKAHRLMQFKRFAQARGQHALVYIASLKFSRVRNTHTSAVTLQRRVRVFLAMSRKRQTLADLANQLRLNSAAVTLQSFARCEITRKNYARERTQGLAYAKLMTILGCEGDDLDEELVLFHYQMSILKTEGQLEKV